MLSIKIKDKMRVCVTLNYMHSDGYHLWFNRKKPFTNQPDWEKSYVGSSPDTISKEESYNKALIGYIEMEALVKEFKEEEI